MHIYICIDLFLLLDSLHSLDIREEKYHFQKGYQQKTKPKQNQINPYFPDYYIEVLNFVLLSFSNFFFLLLTFTQMKVYTSEKNKLEKCDDVFITKRGSGLSIYENIQELFGHNHGQHALRAALEKKGLNQTTPRNHL